MFQQISRVIYDYNWMKNEYLYFIHSFKALIIEMVRFFCNLSILILLRHHISPILDRYLPETTWRIYFNMLSNSVFDACSSARKTFVYARMLAIEDNPHWREKSAFCLCDYTDTVCDRLIHSLELLLQLS